MQFAKGEVSNIEQRSLRTPLFTILFLTIDYIDTAVVDDTEREERRMNLTFDREEIGYHVLLS